METILLNNKSECPVIGIGTFMLSPKDNLDILDFRLTDAEMTKIAKLDKGVRYYNRTDAMLASFAAWRPDFEKA